MRFTRYLSLLVSLALLGLPAVLLSAGPAAAAEATQVGMKVTPKGVKVYGYKFSIAGQVSFVRPEDGKRYAVNSGGVKLQRKYKGKKAWRTVQTDATAGSYDFDPVRANANAAYRVVYSGGSTSAYTFSPSSSAAKSVKVARKIADRGVKRNGRLLLKGKVAPSWKHKNVIVQRKLCKAKRCDWKTYTVDRTNQRGQFRARVSAPRTGSWFYRVKVRGTTKYVTSYGTTYRAYSL